VSASARAPLRETLVMVDRTIPRLLPSLIACVVLGAFAACAAAETGGQAGAAESRRVGIASFYANRFAGRTMADGTPMNPHGDNAASRTLPLGTRARVTNLQTGQSALVTIRDRGPYIRGRIVDLSPATARLLGITPKQGLAPVEVVPLAEQSTTTAALPWN
jgi:rare lipoprotein A